MQLGDLYTKEGRHEEGLEIDKQLTRLCPDEPMVLYNLACSYSLLCARGKAFEAIKRAIGLGYDDLDYLETDDDLKNLRLDQSFQEYFQKIRREKGYTAVKKFRALKVFKDQ